MVSMQSWFKVYEKNKARKKHAPEVNLKSRMKGVAMDAMQFLVE